ncbi:hypothetical protein [Kitasatospora sp. NPDC057015]|uniref:hypothetical protein n=1 Tax=Kitasatospora sp. NPDC057015 TaxID=3346001 RepID=UPI00363450B2
MPTATRATAEQLCGAAGLELYVYDRIQLRPPAPPRSAPATASDGLTWILAAAKELHAIIAKGKPVGQGQVAKVLKTAAAGAAPIGGQLAALTAVVNRHGTELDRPLDQLTGEARLLLAALKSP